MEFAKVNDIDAHVLENVDEFGFLQAFRDAACLLLCLFGDVVQTVLDVVMAGEGLIAWERFE